MKIKKSVVLVVLFVVLICTVSAQSGQKIFRVDSSVYSTIQKLYLLQGRAMPSSTGPWSAAELQMMLEKIDTASLPDALYEEYSAALAEVKKNGEKGNADINSTVSRAVNTEAYIHTNTDGSEIQGNTDSDSWNRLKLYSGRDGWSYDLTKITPFYVMNWETWVSDDFYGWFEFPLQNTFRTQTLIGDKNFATNIFGLQNGSFDMNVADLNFPYRAFIGFGSDNWSFELGRDRLNWGLGTTGNLMMSDNFPYHNMLRYSAFSDSYKYTFLVSTYPHEMNWYYDEGDETAKYHLTNNANSDVEGNEFYISHRIEGRFFGDRLAATLTESVMVQYATNHIPWELINPVSFWHNNYTASSSNSILGLEFDWTAFRGFNVYGQFALDEIQLFGEDTHWPNGLAVLGGVTYAMPVLDGVMKLNVEGARTDPYAYLRYGSSPGASEPYGIDFIAADRIYSVDLANRPAYEEFCLGYQYGPDCIVGNFNCDWENAKLRLDMNYFFMAHGTHDFWTRWAKKGSLDEDYVKANYTTPTVSHASSANARFDISDRDSVWYTNAITLGASYQVLPSLNVYGQTDFVITKNAFNDSKNGTENDLQLVLGVKFTF